MHLSLLMLKMLGSINWRSSSISSWQVWKVAGGARFKKLVQQQQ